MAKSYSVTSAGVNPAEDRAHRMRLYFIAMSLRVACVASLFWVRGWWVLLAAAGAVLLPWFAVMVGNAVAHGGGDAPDAPAPLQLEGGAGAETDGPGAESLIVIDVDPERRARPAGGPPPGSPPAAPADAVRTDPAVPGADETIPGDAP
jgi:hypothetical protein